MHRDQVPENKYLIVSDQIVLQVSRNIMAIKKCTSCNAPLAEVGGTSFGCPQCEYEIKRCERCREQSIAYMCPQCGFQGP